MFRTSVSPYDFNVLWVKMLQKIQIWILKRIEKNTDDEQIFKEFSALYVSYGFKVLAEKKSHIMTCMMKTG